MADAAHRMKTETPFQFDLGLILVDIVVGGPRARMQVPFVLDTGAAMTAIVPRVAEQLGYSPADAIGLTVTRTAVGAERGYIVRVASFAAFGYTFSAMPVMVADLSYDMDGVLGMDVLVQFNVEIRPGEQQIVVEKLG